MNRYTHVLLAFLLLSNLSLISMEQDDFLPELEDVPELNTVDVPFTKKPKSLVDSCLSHFARKRTVHVEDTNTIKKITNKNLPSEITNPIIEALPTNVVQTFSKELANLLIDDIGSEIKIAIIEKLALCDVLTSYREISNKLWDDPTTDISVKNALIKYDPEFAIKLLSKIDTYIYSDDEKQLIEKIDSAREQYIKYQLDAATQNIFNNLGGNDRLVGDKIRSAFLPYVEIYKIS